MADFQASRVLAGSPSLVVYDFRHACVACRKAFVSFSEARWNPKRSQSSFTEGTLLSAIEGLLEDLWELLILLIVE